MADLGVFAATLSLSQSLSLLPPCLRSERRLTDRPRAGASNLCLVRAMRNALTWMSSESFNSNVPFVSAAWSAFHCLFFQICVSNELDAPSLFLDHSGVHLCPLSQDAVIPHHFVLALSIFQMTNICLFRISDRLMAIFLEAA